MAAPGVTIVANDVGGIGGMERQLEKLITGLLDAGGNVTVISRTLRLRPHERLRWVRVKGPRRPFSVAYPWFWLAASVVSARRRRGILHSTGAIIANHVDVTTVHYCHLGVRQNGRMMRRRRANFAYAVNAWLAACMSEAGERWSYRKGRVRHLVAVSDGVARELRTCFRTISDRIEIIPNGVDLDEFRPDPVRRGAKRAALGLDDSALVAVFVGGDWERKGLEHAIVALGCRPAWHLIVAGTGDTDDYLTKAASEGCAGRVHFVGAVGDVSSYFAAGDAFVLPTRYEAAPLVVYEAAACGLPLLVTRVNGVDDILQEGVNGWFIEQDARTIAPRLAALERDAELRARMGRLARDAVKLSDWESVVSSYIDLYSDLARDGASDRSVAMTATRPARAPRSSPS
jgi:glycosyltransferase involved in cell wall biosynthesis